jgi:hypothetical protein
VPVLDPALLAARQTADRRTWLTARQAADHANRSRQLLSVLGRRPATVTERTIRSWVARKHLHVAGLDDDNRQLFRLADVARAEKATRERALRLVGIPSST